MCQTGERKNRKKRPSAPVSKGLYAWGGAASTDFWIDHEEELVGIIHTQLLPSGTYPTAQLMQLTTYQAIVE